MTFSLRRLEIITMIKKITAPLLVLILLGTLGFALMQKNTVPDVTITTIKNEKISLSAQKGKMLLVSFWATDCPGCIKEMPDLIKTYNHYQNRGLSLVAVSMSYDPPQQLLNYVKANALPFPVMHDTDEAMSQAFGKVNLTPTTFVIDKNGHIIQKIIGEVNFKELNKLLDKELSA